MTRRYEHVPGNISLRGIAKAIREDKAEYSSVLLLYKGPC